ncbi:MAG: 50S ribosomal protein L13 [Thermoplasmata archaeon]
MNMVIYDASGQILGRLSSLTAKRLLEGETVTIVNAEEAVITGSRQSILREYQQKRRVGSQRKGPYFPKRPDRILKRTVRGMLPYQRPRGRAAFKRLRVYAGAPPEIGGEPEEAPGASIQGKTTTYITLRELSKLLGAKS